jgi:hypothetical protein
MHRRQNKRVQNFGSKTRRKEIITRCSHRWEGNTGMDLTEIAKWLPASQEEFCSMKLLS